MAVKFRVGVCLATAVVLAQDPPIQGMHRMPRTHAEYLQGTRLDT